MHCDKIRRSDLSIMGSHTSEILMVLCVIFCLWSWWINELIWEKTASVALHPRMLSVGSSLPRRPRTGLFWFTRSVCISHSHIIENIRLPALDKKKNAVALSDGSSCWAAWKWLWFVRQVRPCAVTKEPAVALTPTGCRIIGILPGAFSLF